MKKARGTRATEKKKTLRRAVPKPGKPSKVAAKRPASKAPARRAAMPKDVVAALRVELKRSEARFSSLVQTAAAPILLLSTDLIVLELNSEAEQLYARPRGAMVGSDYFAMLDPDGCGGLTREHFRQVLAGRAARSCEGRVRRPDGGERVLLWNATRLLGPKGSAIGVIAVAQDITERQQAEDALREREARLSSIIATAPDAIITIDDRGVVQSFSAAAERLFGYSAGEVIGRNVSMLMPSPHRESHDGYLARYLRTGERRIIGIGRKVEATRKDGTVFPMELAVGEVKIGKSHFFTGFIRDLTSRMRMEEELRQSQKMEAVGQLTGGIAHDFNNLLTVITGNLEMLENRVDKDDDREILREAQEAAELGAKLANRLLAFGRRQPLQPKPTDLSALVGGMGDLLRRSLGEQIHIETRLARDLPLTTTDPGQVENALLNLAINARDAMPEGGRLVIETAAVEVDADYATAHADLASGRYVVLAVTDTGAGIAPEIRERVFEPFFTTKGPGSGTGLGLSMVYGFVKQSGGHIQLYSELGRGTTVRIYLPAMRADEDDEADAGDVHAGTKGRGETVLVVEDDERVRRVSVRRLTTLGYNIIEAESGAEALAVLDKGEAVDLVFTDIVMPGGITGVDLARQIRVKRPDVKVLFTSGYAEPAIMKGGLLTTGADWLGKPYRTADLALKVRTLLDG